MFGQSADADDPHPFCENVYQDEPTHLILSSSWKEASFYQELIMGLEFLQVLEKNYLDEFFAPYAMVAPGFPMVAKNLAKAVMAGGVIGGLE